MIAVSGGADSVAMALAVKETAPDLNPTIAHLDHQLRGEDARGDAIWVSQLAEKLDVPFVGDAVDVAARAANASAGIEETARGARYDFLRRVAREVRAGWVMTAHTADDQVETVLHRIIRGTGIAGLAGMREMRPLENGIMLLRPMLNVRRRDVIDFLSHRDQDHREDASNQDDAFTRNRIRHSLLPQLESFNPNVADATLRLAAQAESVSQMIHGWASELLSRALIRRSQTHVALRRGPLMTAPAHLCAQALLVCWDEQSWPRGGMSAGHWNRMAGLVGEGGRETFPGPVDVQVGKSTIELAAKLESATGQPVDGSAG